MQRAALELLRRVTPNAFSRYGDRIASLLDDRYVLVIELSGLVTCLTRTTCAVMQ